MIFFTADLHFYHSKIIEYCNRPFKTVEEMNDELIYKWNFTVREQDTVVLAGDLGFGRGALECVSRLNGEIILIKGNHDYRFSNTSLIKSGIDEIFNRNNFSLYVNGFPRINVSHFPLTKRFGLNLCGHVHDRWLIKDNFLNVGVDVHDFSPVSLTDLKFFNLQSVR